MKKVNFILYLVIAIISCFIIKLNAADTAVEIPKIYSYLSGYSALSVMENDSGYLNYILIYSDGNINITTNGKGEKYPTVSQTTFAAKGDSIKGSDPSVSYFRYDPDTGCPEFLITFIQPDSVDASVGDFTSEIVELDNSEIKQKALWTFEKTSFLYKDKVDMYVCVKIKEWESVWEMSWINGHKTTIGTIHTGTSSCYIGTENGKYYFVAISPKQKTDNSLQMDVLEYDTTANTITNIFSSDCNVDDNDPCVSCAVKLNNNIAKVVITGEHNYTPAGCAGDGSTCRRIAVSVFNVDINNKSITQNYRKSDGLFDGMNIEKDSCFNPTIMNTSCDNSGNISFSVLCNNGVGWSDIDDRPEYYTSYTQDITLSPYEATYHEVLSDPKELLIGIPNIIKEMDLAFFPGIFKSKEYGVSGIFTPIDKGMEEINFYALKDSKCSDLNINKNNIIRGADHYFAGNFYTLLLNASNQYINALPDGFSISPYFSTDSAVFELDDSGNQIISFIPMHDVLADQITCTCLDGSSTILLNLVGGTMDYCYHANQVNTVTIPAGKYLKSISGDISTRVANDYGAFNLISKNLESVEFIPGADCFASNGTVTFNNNDHTLVSLSQIDPSTVFKSGETANITLNLTDSAFFTQLSFPGIKINPPNSSIFKTFTSFEENALPDNADYTSLLSTNLNVDKGESDYEIFKNQFSNYIQKDGGLYLINSDKTLTCIIPVANVNDIVVGDNMNGLLSYQPQSQSLSIMNPSSNICTNIGWSQLKYTAPVTSMDSNDWNTTTITHKDGNSENIILAGFDSKGTVYYSDSKGIYDCKSVGTPTLLSTPENGVQNCVLDANGSIWYIDGKNTLWCMNPNLSSSSNNSNSFNSPQNILNIPQDASSKTLTIMPNGFVLLASDSSGELYIGDTLNVSCKDMYKAGVFCNNSKKDRSYVKAINFTDNTISLEDTNGNSKNIDIYRRNNNLYEINDDGLSILSSSTEPKLLQSEVFEVADGDSNILLGFDFINGTLYAYDGNTLDDSLPINYNDEAIPVSIVANYKTDSGPKHIYGIIGYSDGSADYFFYSNKKCNCVQLLAADNHEIASINKLHGYPDGYKITYKDGSSIDFDNIIGFCGDGSDSNLHALASRINYVQGQNNTYYLYYLSYNTIPEILTTDGSLNSINMSDNFPYIAAEGNIYSLDKNGYPADNELVTDKDQGGVSHNVTAIATNGDNIYYADDANHVYECSVSGGTPKELQPESGTPGDDPYYIKYDDTKKDLVVSFLSGGDIPYAIK